MEVTGSKPTGRMAPVPANRGPRRSDAFPQPRPTGPSAMPGRQGCPVSLGTESCRRQIRERELSDRQTDSLRQSSIPSWARGKPTVGPRGAKARRRTLTRAAAGPGRSRSSGQGLGSPRPRLPRGCLLRDAGVPGLGLRGVSRWKEAVAETARHQLRDQDGDAGSSASERRRAGGRDCERQRAAPAGRGLQPREAPPRKSTLPRSPPRHQGAEGGRPLPRVGWGMRGSRGCWAQVLVHPQGPRTWMWKLWGEILGQESGSL